MIAYNNEWLNNLLIQQELELAANDNMISEEEKITVSKLYTVGFYTPNLFIKIGLFILTIIVIIFTFGIVALITSSVNEQTFGITLIIFGLMNYGALEVVAQLKNHYHSGVDDALLWMAGTCIIGGINLLGNISIATNCLFVLIIAACILWRFAHALLGAVVVVSFLLLFFLSYIKWGNMAKATAPFCMLLIAAGIYFLSVYLSKQFMLKFYVKAITFAKITALICAYASVNYFIVNHVASGVIEINVKPGAPVAFGWLFWLLTFIIPFIYIFSGVQKKDMILLRVGLLLIAAIVFTVRYYYPVLPIEIAMIAGGISCIAIGYGLLKYLQAPKHGFTSIADIDKNTAGKLTIESLIIAETFSNTQQPPAATTNFGGGSFGGGGASGDF